MGVLKKKKSVSYNSKAGTKTVTKTNLRGVTKKKTTGPGVKLKQKTKKSGQQKIKGYVTTKSNKLTVRNKGKVASKKKGTPIKPSGQYNGSRVISGSKAKGSRAKKG